MQFDHVAQQVPDIAEAVDWQLRTVPGSVVLHQDPTWALVESGGAKLAFVLADQHPPHLAYRVDEEELERLARENGAEIATHRDRTRSIYLQGPGSLATEIISYPAASPRPGPGSST
ncbi:MAG: VOC family protein [Thermoleophilia bacterium]